MEQIGINGITQRHTWPRYKEDIVRVILEALTMLREREDLIADEVDLNRKLFFCFKRAAHKLRLSHHLPVPEGKNPPYEDDEQRAARENKRPDFYWQFCDASVDDPKWCDRRFVLECKRLGKPRSSTPNWILTRNYIQHGITRFLSGEHEYAKGDDSGAMIGYVENMEFDVILSEVNTYMASSTVPISPLSIPAKGWQKDGISALEHTLIRTFPISPFLLLHFWIDFREHNLLLPEPKNKNTYAEEVFREVNSSKIKARTSDKRTLKERKHGKSLESSSQLSLPIDYTH